jgi:hypothetical protein
MVLPPGTCDPVQNISHGVPAPAAVSSDGAPSVSSTTVLSSTSVARGDTLATPPLAFFSLSASRRSLNQGCITASRAEMLRGQRGARQQGGCVNQPTLMPMPHTQHSHAKRRLIRCRDCSYFQ